MVLHHEQQMLKPASDCFDTGTYTIGAIKGAFRSHNRPIVGAILPAKVAESPRIDSQLHSELENVKIMKNRNRVHQIRFSGDSLSWIS